MSEPTDEERLHAMRRAAASASETAYVAIGRIQEMDPVVEAARAYVALYRQPGVGSIKPAFKKLEAAVRAYEAVVARRS